MTTIIDINSPDAFGQIISAIHKAPVIVQLPRVFVLLAAPTAKGAAQLDRLKSRQANKNYGTAIGDLSQFVKLSRPDSLPEEFTSAQDFSRLTGCFLRVYVSPPNFDSTVIRGGTHQGVILEGIHRRLFKDIEQSFQSVDTAGIWGEQAYFAPLCTSCNISGDPKGSITSLDRAIEFAQDRQVDLLVTSPSAKGEMGSYPIFGIYKDGIQIHRIGPNLDQYQAMIPGHLKRW
ncbi:MAG: hypothetical protein AAF587_20470 [Bacteroidota bacterium]